jgi:hypothetical protein
VGAAKTSLVIVFCLLLIPKWAWAEDKCTGRTSSGSPFATCFDPGNRLFLEAGTSGIGGGIRLRHVIEFDDEPDLLWKLEHRFAEILTLGLNENYAGVVYSGRFLRHARDGHLVLPLGVPRKIFLPFDIGAEFDFGRIRQAPGDTPLAVKAVRVAGLIDLSRSPSFRRRLSIGIVGHWDMQVDTKQRSLLENRVAPLSLLSANGYLESKNGLNRGEFRLEGGREWSNLSSWQWNASASLLFERVLIALNDRPLSLVVEGRAQAPDVEYTALVGARLSLFSARGSFSQTLAGFQGSKQR